MTTSSGTTDTTTTLAGQQQQEKQEPSTTLSSFGATATSTVVPSPPTSRLPLHKMSVVSQRTDLPQSVLSNKEQNDDTATATTTAPTTSVLASCKVDAPLDTAKRPPTNSSSSTMEPETKRIKSETTLLQQSDNNVTQATSPQQTSCAVAVATKISSIPPETGQKQTNVLLQQQQQPVASIAAVNTTAVPASTGISAGSIPASSSGSTILQGTVQHKIGSTSSTSTAAAAAIQKPLGSQNSLLSDTQPKATTMAQLRTKYMMELDYMLCEFQKLERQLLGAKSSATESAGSKERREKLHSFILHLQDTMQQIQAGCKADETNASTPDTSPETVTKLEEHIQANLIPVKIRLKKQLAAQQGAKHNPVGVPVAHRGYTPPTQVGTATFAAAAARKTTPILVEHKPPAEPVKSSETQFGKPIKDGGSILTKKLHGTVLGSKEEQVVEVTNAAVEQASVSKPKVQYAGLAVGSTQADSSRTAASNAHQLGGSTPNETLLPVKVEKQMEAPSTDTIATAAAPSLPTVTETKSLDVQVNSTVVTAEGETTDEEKRRLRKLKRKKKLKIMREKKTDTTISITDKSFRKKQSRQVSKRRGPHSVEYMCSLCNEIYNSTCDCNPWWALTQHDCPKCKKLQIPRIDISVPANAIEYHPALLAHAEDPSNGSSSSPVVKPIMAVSTTISDGKGAEAGSTASDLSDDDDLSDVYSDSTLNYSDASEVEGFSDLSPPEQAEVEKFGASYSGPKLTVHNSSRLITMMLHASVCPCRHKSIKHKDVCLSTKWMMLHVRDCTGTTLEYDVCPYPWCRQVKHLLYHLVTCTEQESCNICMPHRHSKNMSELRKQCEGLLEKQKAVVKSDNEKTDTVAPDASTSSTATT